MSFYSLDSVLQVFVIVTGLAGQYFVTKRQVKGFYLWVLSNFAFMGLHYLSDRPLMIGLHAVYLGFCVWGILEWQTSEKTLSEE